LATHFVTGGTGLVGRALIASLVADDEQVVALAHTSATIATLAALGATPVLGDLTTPGGWQIDAADADVLWHLGLPRVRTPLRGSRVRKEARLAWKGAHNAIADRDPTRPVVAASHVLAWGRHGPGPIHEDTPVAPLAMGHWALAAEQALEATPLRVVRLGWGYGPDGRMAELVRAIAQRRFRIVGDGSNRFPLISAADAARALRAAAAEPPGTYVAAEPDIPTQDELIHHICAEVGAGRPDHLTHRMASLALGGQMAHALASSLEVSARRMDEAGWAPADQWRESLVEISRY
jgi:nucleoside-diphosphate-sugar epimerase